MSPEKTLIRINEIIVEEKGYAVTLDKLLVDADLDSLGISIVLITIDSEFDILKEGEDLLDLDIPNLTIMDLVEKCISPTTSTSTEPKTEETI
jgi:acyl carrier protein